METLSKSYIKKILHPRKSDSHKGDYGHALIFAGSKSKMGASVISARACLRSGVGLLTLNVPEEERVILQVCLPEAMLQFREAIEMDLTVFSAVAVGPAFGTNEDSIHLFKKILQKINKPLLLDADALTILSKKKELIHKIPINTLLTPHPKEFDRLFGIHNTREERIQTAILKAKELKCIIILKGYQTIITDGEKSFLNTNGNSGLAKGGSGDALTGIITSLMAQKYDLFHAAQIGVFVHGLSSDLTLNSQSEESMIITDIIENIGKAFIKIG